MIGWPTLWEALVRELMVVSPMTSPQNPLQRILSFRKDLEQLITSGFLRVIALPPESLSWILSLALQLLLLLIM